MTMRGDGPPSYPESLAMAGQARLSWASGPTVALFFWRRLRPLLARRNLSSELFHHPRQLEAWLSLVFGFEFGERAFQRTPPPDRLLDPVDHSADCRG